MQQKIGKVLIAGGGTAGVMAALAAARNGAEVTLVEQAAFVGGVAAFGIPFLAFKDGKGRQVVGGLAQELVERLVQLDESPGHVGGAYWAGAGAQQQFHLTPYNPEAYKYLVTKLLQEAGVKLLLHSKLVSCSLDSAGLLTTVTIATKDGLWEEAADFFIDATGDADLARLAECPFRQGDNLRQMQNVSGIFTLADVDAERALSALMEGKAMQGWGSWHTRVVRGRMVGQQEGINHFAGQMAPWDDGQYYAFTAVAWRKGVYSFNISRTTGIDGTSSSDLNWAEQNERLQMYEIFQGMKANVPGFASSQLISSSAVGIRESANIEGLYTMQKSDVLEGKEHPDNIARGCYPIDIHDPQGGHTSFHFIKNGSSYGIPLRSLVPSAGLNLLVAGRCLAASHAAHGSTRIMATAMATGEAAGTAAVQALKQGCLPGSAQYDLAALQKKLLQQGAIL